MIVTFDAETWGPPGFEFQQKHPEWKNLFIGWYDGKEFLYDVEPLFCWGSADILVGANAKYDLRCLKQQRNCSWEGPIRDVQVQAHLLHEELSSYHLEDLAKLYGYSHPNYKKLVNFKAKKEPYYYEDIPTLTLYNCHDLLAPRHIFDKQVPQIAQRGLQPLVHLMGDFIKELADVETKGLQIDTEFLEEKGEQLREQKAQILQQLPDLTEDFNWDSPAQVGDWLHKQKVNLPKTASGQYQTTTSVLEKIEHPVAKLVVELREANKQLGTYVEGFLATLIDGKYYPDYKLTSTVTGRLSEKFIQVMPRKETSDFKRCVVSKFPGGVLLGVDWSQLEARLMAEMCWFLTGKHQFADDLESGKDIHAETLARFPFLPDRTRAKNANFSVIFGGKGYTLCQDYGFTKEQADEFLKDLTVVRYPEFQEYFKYMEESCWNKGYVTNPYTKRRRHTTNYNQAYNAPIQGLGTDFNKIMLTKCNQALVGFQSEAIGEVHDEVLFDIYPGELPTAQKVVMSVYENLSGYFYDYFGVELKMKYGFEMKVGKNLFDMVKVS